MKQTAKQAHRNLALFIGLFVLIHFSAHLAAPFGIDAQSTALHTGRAIYQFPLIEILLVMALAAQVILGIRLLRQITARKRKGFWHRVQFISGAYLAFFIVLHTSAAVGTRLIASLDTNFYWAAGTLVLTPLKYTFAPYYVLAVTALVSHILAALHFRGPKPWQGPTLALGPLLGIAIVSAYSGAFYSIELPQEHRDYFAIFPGVSDED